MLADIIHSGTPAQGGRFRVRFTIGQLEIFQVTCSYSVDLESAQTRRELSTKVCPLGIKCGRRVELQYAVLVVPNVTVSSEAQHLAHPRTL